MAILPDNLRFTSEEQRKLDQIRKDARQRHEQARKTARRQGRLDFPMFPYECSAAYEEEFRRRVRSV